MAAVNQTKSSTSSRIATYKLEFGDSGGGLSWNLIRHTLEFVDVLLTKQVQAAIEEEVQAGSLPQQTNLLRVKSKSTGLSEGLARERKCFD